MTASTIILILLSLFVLIAFLSTFKVVPQRSAYIVERLGKYSRTLEAGFHILIPFIDKIAYRQNQKEQAIDVASQTCITKDNIAVEVDGILYLQVIDPQKASYGIDNYKFAVVQISQTTMRSIIGKMELDKTFEERETVNASIVDAVDKASDPWGIKVSAVEVKHVDLPEDMRRAMSRQAEAEREKRAKIIHAEGELIASEKLSLAAAVIQKEPGAMTLRYLQTLNEIAAEQNSTIVFPLPMDLLPLLRKEI